MASLQSSPSEGVLICSEKGSHVKTKFMRVEEKYGCPLLQRTGPRKERPPLRQEDARRPSRQPACLVVESSPEFSKERAKGGNGLQTLLPTLWASRAHSARHNTDKVTQWSTGLNTRPWEPGHKSATPGESNIQKGPLEAWGSIWDAASNEPTGKQLCMWGQGSSTCLCATLRALSSV